jgi:putative oxidoreductase
MNPMTLLKPVQLPTGASAGLLVLRAAVGLAFVLHGYGKIQNPFAWMGPESAIPGFLQLLAAVSEFVGGIAWILGLLTPLFSLGLASTMAVAVYFHAVMFGDPFVANAAGKGSYEPALVYLCVAILLLLAGPGRYSVDRALFGEMQ